MPPKLALAIVEFKELAGKGSQSTMSDFLDKGVDCDPWRSYPKDGKKEKEERKESEQQ